MIALVHPWALALALLLPVAALLRRRRHRGALGLPDGAAALAAASRPGLAFLVPTGRCLGLLLLICALAGPELRHKTTTPSGRGVDVMLAIDLSESMAAMDFRLADRSVTRLEGVAEAAAKLAASRPGDRIGLVAFGSRAYLVLPPTTDREALFQALSHLEVGAAGKRTAMGDGLGLALRRLRQASGLARVVILLGDGGSNAGEVTPETGALAAADLGMRVHVVGVGRDEPAPFLVNHPLLGREIIHEKAPVDEAVLAGIARTASGLYFRADDAAGLDKALMAIGAREQSDMTVTTRADGIPLAPLGIALAVCCLTAYAALGNTRFVRLP